MFYLDPKHTIHEHVSAGVSQSNMKVTLSKLAQEVIRKPSEKSVSTAIIVGIIQFIEALLLAALGFAIYWFYVDVPNNQLYVPMILGSTLVANAIFNLARTHSMWIYRTGLHQLGRLLAAWSMVFVIIVLTGFLLKFSDQLSRAWMVSWYGTGAVMLILFRRIVRTQILKWTANGKLKLRTAVVGGGKDAEALINAIRNDRDANNEIEFIGLFDDREDKRSPETVASCPKLGSVDELIEFARQTPLDLVIVSMPLSAEDRVLHMLKRLWILPVDIRLSAHMSKLRLARSAYSYIGNIAMFDMADKPISDWNLVFKWVFDKVVAVSALIVLSPIMLITALAIRMESKGPILFRQARHGFNNELINIYKFRSMYADQSDANAAKLATRDDPRITRVGKFIRKTSIDELPQLFNVLKGELSVVGPRPHALQAKADNTVYHEAVGGYFARHRVKPGMTGLAQIHGWRGETDTVEKIEQRVNHDLHYIENWTPFSDIYILFMTPFSLFSKNENAF